MTESQPARSLEIICGPDEMASRLSAPAWCDTPLGPSAQWPPALRNAVSLMLESGVPMLVLVGQNLITLYNDAYIKLLGDRHPAALGRDFFSVWPEHRVTIGPIADRVLAGESLLVEDTPVKLKRDKATGTAWFTFSYSPLRDQSGAVIGIFCVCFETAGQSALKNRHRFQLKMADSLRELAAPSEVIGTAARRLGEYLGCSRVGYGEVDADEKRVRVARDWTDGSQPSIDGMTTALDAFGPEVIAALRQGNSVRVSDIAADPRSAPYAAAYEQIGTRSMMVIPLIKGGRLSAFLSIGASAPRDWTDEDMLVAQDVGESTWAAIERARAEQALAARLGTESEHLRNLFEQAPGFMAILRGPEHVFEQTNLAFRRLIGSRELKGKSVRDAMPDLAGQGFMELLDTVFISRQPYSGTEARIVLRPHPDRPAVERYVDFVYQPVVEADGTVSGIFVQGSDVTERYRANHALREADRRKDDFLAMLGHELRNPLAPIAAAAELLDLAAANEKRVREISQIIVRQAGHMNSLIDDLLDVSRVTRGLVSLERVPVDLNEVVGGALEQTRTLVGQRKHRLTVSMATQPAWVEGDRTRLVQVVSNLLNNAAKYTPEGGHILLRIDLEEKIIEFRIKDNGNGIAPEFMPFLFGLFSQGNRRPDRSEGGLGLGLSLVKSLVELHGGRVSAHSEGVGKGCEFIVRLPRTLACPDRQVAAETPPLQASGTSPPGLRLLVVDDNREAADSLAMLLRERGHAVSVEYTAGTALERAATESPQAVLLDIGLPDTNGHELALRLRELKSTAKATLIAITGYGQPDDRKRSAEAGIDHHLVKPVDTAELLRLLGNIATPPQTRTHNGPFNQAASQTP